MASLMRPRYSLFPVPPFFHGRRPRLVSWLEVTRISEKFGVLSCSHGDRDEVYSLRCSCKAKDGIEMVESRDEVERRPPFDINLAVVLAGFAFEAYWSPPENAGKHEVDAADCKTVYLSRAFLHEIYDGQLIVKVNKGYDFPAMDPWGTSDPYVVLQLDGQGVKSGVRWGRKSPTWNEELALNVKVPPSKKLEVAAWDANLVTPHKRLGNALVGLDCLCDGNLHELIVELEGMGGGGKIQLEVKYESYDEIDEEKKWWKVPSVAELFRYSDFESAVKRIIGSETVQARQFAQLAFGRLKAFQKGQFPSVLPDRNPQLESSSAENDSSSDKGGENIHLGNDDNMECGSSSLVMKVGEMEDSDKYFWKNLADVVNQNVQKFGFPLVEKIKWEGFDLLKKMGSQSQKIAEKGYIESGLASPECQNFGDDDDNSASSGSSSIGIIQSLLPDIKKATQDILKQTDSILGALMVHSAAVSKPNKEAQHAEKDKTAEIFSTRENLDVSEHVGNERLDGSLVGSVSSEQKAEETRKLFSTTESAMEAWAMLATSLGHPSFIKSEFEKLCFLDNPSTDTQVAVWRDSAQKRIVVAFRGTEQAKWKDLQTDLMLVPAGLNPERIGGDFKQEMQVHSGFLSAYDSVRMKIMSLIKLSIGFRDDDVKPHAKWHVYVTGHSLGGALSTLLALELSSSKLVEYGSISLTMYNFGSPRVGNKWFAKVYNEKVEDSWRVVNHRDIIPTIPRLMGYCHVAQPIYLATQNPSAVGDAVFLEDGYQVDVIGESTPDALVSEFMKGENELIERLLQTEINIFRSIRDGTALMQHMEDFYYISLLEIVRPSYQTAARPKNNEESAANISIG